MGKLRHYFDIVIFLAHRSYWNIASHFGKVHGLVLMYHYITDEHVNTMPNCVHSPTVFEGTLKRLISEGYEFVSVKEMLDIIRKKEDRKYAVVTFDDIMDDVYNNAYPILKKMRIPFTLFVASGLIDKPKYVTSDHLKEMDLDDLCTVGSHTVNHVSLRKINNSLIELKDSKRQLEALLGHEIEYMAYPYGWHCDVSPKVMKQTQLVGYKCAFGTIQSPVSEISSRNLFYLPRMVLAE